MQLKTLGVVIDTVNLQTDENSMIICKEIYKDQFLKALLSLRICNFGPG